MATISLSSNTNKRPTAPDIRTNSRSSRPQGPGSPHTPQQSRQPYSPFTGSSSPGSSFRHEEDSVILEVGSRNLRAGFEGNSSPTCVVGFGPEEARRVGDYRGWIRTPNQDVQKATVAPTDADNWLTPYELWRKDIRGLDVGLFEDRIERAIRELHHKYLLTDAGSARLVLVLPSIVPHVLLSALLSTIFHRWRYPSITLLPSSAMAAVAAGIRSALVVDIGWEETTVTALYEYREIRSKRSTRAIKLLTQRTGHFLTRITQQKAQTTVADNDKITISVDLCEEVLTRLAWCKTRNLRAEEPASQEADELGRPSALDDNPDDTSPSSLHSKLISVPLPVGNSISHLQVPFLKFSELVDEALFAGNREENDWDDEDAPLDVLLYNTLLSLSSDVRGTCMPRIVFIGGGSNIPGIRQRILEDLDTLIKKNNWRLSRGKIIQKPVNNPRQTQTTSKQGQEVEAIGASTSPSDLKPDTSFIDERLERANKDCISHTQGSLRQVDSLGAWAGASLVASMKIKGLVEVDREKFLQHGLAGAGRDYNISAAMARRSGYGQGPTRSGNDRSSWTLGEWA